MKIKKIAHIADIHLRKTNTRNEEYVQVFERLIESLKKEKPDRIVIVGDLVNDYITLDGDQLIISHTLLNSLCDIAPVRITKGNHDFLKTNSNRTDAVKAIVKTLKNPNIEYYDETDFYTDENVIWTIWKHGEKNNNPWLTNKGKKYLKKREEFSEYTFIDLYHDPINSCISDNGLKLKSKQYRKLSDFKGDYGFFGDIHKKQYLNKEKTKAYSGSLIAQKFSEGDDDFHGYLLWDIENKTVEEHPIHNDYSYKNILISPYTDFDDLDFEIDNPTKHMRVRFLWRTLPSYRNKENQQKVESYLKSKYDDVKISHKNEFIEDDVIDVQDNETLNNITEQSVQQEIFKDYFEKIGLEEEQIKDILKLDNEISDLVGETESTNIEWDVVKFGGRNFMSYEKFDIDWRDMDGIFQIKGDNAAGKTTLVFKFLPYMLYGKTPETEARMKFGDLRYVNNRNDATHCEGYLVLDINGEYYGIKKRTDIQKNRSGEITATPTKFSYYLLSDPDEDMTDDNALESLDEDRKEKTQKKLLSVIGTYEDFMRTVMTTSDTLNLILSNDMAVFIDSLLYESGLDVFDKKLDALKKYEKEINKQGRIICDVDATKEKNEELRKKIDELNSVVKEHNEKLIPEINKKIGIGEDFIEEKTKSLFRIDPEIYNLDVEDTKNKIIECEREIKNLKAKKTKLDDSLKDLKETYDAERLSELEEKKANHKDNEFNLKMEIRGFDQEISSKEHSIEVLRGEIIRLKEEGKEKKESLISLKKDKVCPFCKEKLSEENQKHFKSEIEKLSKRVYEIAEEIEDKKTKIKKYEKEISELEDKKVEFDKKIEAINNEMDEVLVEIGEINNDKNDVEKRKEIEGDLKTIPSELKSYGLEIEVYEQKLTSHENSLKQIKENKKTEAIIESAKERLSKIKDEKETLQNKVYELNLEIKEKQNTISINEETITKFKEQEYKDDIVKKYRKCIHRDGLPRQLLINNIIPKTNLILSDVLKNSQFKVWLNPDDLRPKLVYDERPDAVIDCLSASGKERTFSSIVLKFSLNQNNIKSRPQIFLLDEVMGKLDKRGVEEFVEIIHTIKEHMRRILIVEHVHQINPDYVIEVFIDNNGISDATIT